MAVSTSDLDTLQTAHWYSEAAASDISVIPAPASGRRIRIRKILVTANGTSGRFQLHWGAVASGSIILDANALSNSAIGPFDLILLGPLATALQMSTGQTTSGTIWYDIA